MPFVDGAGIRRPAVEIGVVTMAPNIARRLVGVARFLA